EREVDQGDLERRLQEWDRFVRPPGQRVRVPQDCDERRQLGLDLPGLARRHAALEQGDGLKKASVTQACMTCTVQGERQAERGIDGSRYPDRFVPDRECLRELTPLGVGPGQPDMAVDGWQRRLTEAFDEPIAVELL